MTIKGTIKNVIAAKLAVMETEMMSDNFDLAAEEKQLEKAVSNKDSKKIQSYILDCENDLESADSEQEKKILAAIQALKGTLK